MSTTANTAFSESHLREALTACYIPSLRRDIVAAGLLRSATLEPDKDAPGANIPGVPPRYIARIHLQAPNTGDEVTNAQLQAAIENRLLGLPQISRAEVTLLPALFPILTGS